MSAIRPAQVAGDTDAACVSAMLPDTPALRPVQATSVTMSASAKPLDLHLQARRQATPSRRKTYAICNERLPGSLG